MLWACLVWLGFACFIGAFGFRCEGRCAVGYFCRREARVALVSGVKVAMLRVVSGLMVARASSEDIILKCLPPSDWDYYSFGIVSVITVEPNENSFLVLNISGNFVRYNFEDKSFHRLYDITGTKASRMRDRSRVFQIIESGCCV
ncbi:F-box protein [Senna tora]|uniref:F-box protein n=1 Tax=Senna tora TaxID=362788 RepID=A0A834X9B3_9FABA|nr:F-box protein [Senna tora]